MPLDHLAPPVPRLAATAATVAMPPIPACRAWGARYAATAAAPLLDMTQAVPGYPPHPEMLRRLGTAAADPAGAGYGALEGEAPLREAFATATRDLHGGDVAASDVHITAGANLGFTLAMTAIAAPGDVVLLPTPWFFNHQMALALRGVVAQPLPCSAEAGFLPDPDQAAALIGPRVRAIVLVTPNNPTGAVMPPALIARFATLCRERGIWLVLDETYRDFLAPDAGAPHALFDDPHWREGVVQLYSFSKAYCIPGHRMGAIVAGPALRGALIKAIDNIQICPPRPPQAALAWAIPALAEWRMTNAAHMTERATQFAQAIAQAPDWQLDAVGAYFGWVRIPDDCASDLVAAERLAAEHGIVSLPGSVFGPGGDRHLRLAFARADLATIEALPARLCALAAALASPTHLRS